MTSPTRISLRSHTSSPGSTCELERAAERAETALSVAEGLRLPEVLSQTLNTLSGIAIWREHYEHALALVRHSLEIALDNDLHSAALRAYHNLGENFCRRDRYDEAIDCYRTGLALARRVGNRNWEWQLLGELGYPLFLAGFWEEALAVADEIPEQAYGEVPAMSIIQVLLEVHVARGEQDMAREVLGRVVRFEGSPDVQEHGMYAMANAALLSGEGRFPEAAAAAREARSTVNVLGAASQPVKHGYVEGLEAALTMGDFAEVNTLVAEIEAMKPGGRPPFLSAQAARFRARLAATQGERDGVEQGFKTAEQIFREYGIPFCLAVTQLEHGDWLGAQGGSEDVGPLFAEGREIFERLEAKPWLERLEAAKATHGAEVPA